MADKKTQTIKVTEPPKIPTLNFGGGIPSMFSRNINQEKFNPPGQRGIRTGGQSAFHTQHKGGPVGGGK